MPLTPALLIVENTTVAERSQCLISRLVAIVGRELFIRELFIVCQRRTGSP